MRFKVRDGIIWLVIFIVSISFMLLSYGRRSADDSLKEKGDAVVSEHEKEAGKPRTFGLQRTLRSKKVRGLPLRLVGTIIESDLAESIAVIKDSSSQRQGLYRVADRILGHQIINILRGRVVLLKDGKIFLLDFPLGSEFEPITFVTSDKRIINHDALTERIGDLNEVKEKALFAPHIEAGKIVGLKLTKIKDEELAMMAGLKEGDIITSVNGQPVNSLQKSLEIYKDIRHQERIDIAIKRDSKIENLTYYMNWGK